MPAALSYGAAILIASTASAVCVVLLVRADPIGSRSRSRVADVLESDSPEEHAASEFLAERTASRFWSCANVVVPLLAALTGGLAGHAVLGLWPMLPPAGALDRFLIVGLPAAVVFELSFAWVAERRLLRVGLEFAFALCLCRLLLDRSVYLQSGILEPLAIICGWAMALVFVHELLARLWVHTRQLSIPLAIAMAIFSAGALITMAGYIKGGAAALPWSAAVAGTVAGSAANSKRVDLRCVVGLGVVTLFSLVFIGRYFGRLTTASALLVVCAPAIAWIVELRALRVRAGWRKEALRLFLILAVLIVVLLAGKRQFDRHMRPLMGGVIPARVYSLARVAASADSDASPVRHLAGCEVESIQDLI